MVKNVQFPPRKGFQPAPPPIPVVTTPQEGPLPPRGGTNVIPPDPVPPLAVDRQLSAKEMRLRLAEAATQGIFSNHNPRMVDLSLAQDVWEYVDFLANKIEKRSAELEHP